MAGHTLLVAFVGVDTVQFSRGILNKLKRRGREGKGADRILGVGRVFDRIVRILNWITMIIESIITRRSMLLTYFCYLATSNIIRNRRADDYQGMEFGLHNKISDRI